jgi:hypothetical protein
MLKSNCMPAYIMQSLPVAVDSYIVRARFQRVNAPARGYKSSGKEVLSGER